jgi:cell division protein FtsL
MIAPQLFPQEEAPHKVLRRPRIAAHATRRRKRRAWRLHYGASAKVLIVLAMVLAPVMLYVLLTTSLTSMDYQLDAANAQKAKLTGEVQRLDDRIAYLESRERLARIAAKLGMRDPSQYAVVALKPPPVQKTDGLAFLGWLKR